MPIRILCGSLHCCVANSDTTVLPGRVRAVKSWAQPNLSAAPSTECKVKSQRVLDRAMLISPCVGTHTTSSSRSSRVTSRLRTTRHRPRLSDCQSRTVSTSSHLNHATKKMCQVPLSVWPCDWQGCTKHRLALHRLCSQPKRLSIAHHQ